MNTKIAMSAMSIFAALAVMGGATYAAFTASAKADNNTFATDTVDLQISTDPGGADGTFGSSVDVGAFSNMLPGQSRTLSFWLKNTTTANVSLDTKATIYALNHPNASKTLDADLKVSWVCDTNGDNSLGGENPSTPNSPKDIFDNGWFTNSLVVLPSGVKRFCQMTGTLPGTATNTAAGDNLTFNVRYDGTQVLP